MRKRSIPSSLSSPLSSRWSTLERAPIVSNLATQEKDATSRAATIFEGTKTVVPLTRHRPGSWGGEMADGGAGSSKVNVKSGYNI